MKQTDWKIVYNNYSGVSKRAINLLSKEAGRRLTRQEAVYRIYVLPCEKEGCEISKNTFFVSLYDESPMIRKFVSEEEVPENGFTVKVTKNPDDEEGRFVFLTAKTEQELFYAVVSFLDDYIPEHAPWGGSNHMPDLIFDTPMDECCYSEVSDRKTRSIFTWGHSINDYRAYIDNMARCKLNEVVFWNDHIPINIDEVIEYAHSYGIRVVLGYSWGWREIGNKAKEITEETIEKLKELIVNTYREKYAPVNCDGIYFQSFTERPEEKVGGKLISELVTDMVNEVAEELWKITPDLRLIFGLHASSVKNHLDQIARIDPKIEILWEDCGEFPFYYNSAVDSEEYFNQTLEFIKKILRLRDGKGVGLVFKGVMMLDWSKGVGHHGPYVMGENSEYIIEHDRRMRANAWRLFSATWTQSGSDAYRAMQFINENQLGEVNMCIAGTFDGGIYLPFALCAQMFRRMDEPYSKMLTRVSRRDCIRVD